MTPRMLKPSGLLLFVALILSGCAKKSANDSADLEGKATGKEVVVKPLEKAKPAREQIPGENAVREALAQKQYTAAVERFTALKQAVVTPEQNDAYMELYGQIRTELEDAARSDNKAAEALSLFRLARNGR
jgi:hypothetical protein